MELNSNFAASNCCGQGGIVERDVYWDKEPRGQSEKT
jgi:hypothetical protein